MLGGSDYTTNFLEITAHFPKIIAYTVGNYSLYLLEITAYRGSSIVVGIGELALSKARRS